MKIPTRETAEINEENKVSFLDVARKPPIFSINGKEWTVEALCIVGLMRHMGVKEIDRGALNFNTIPPKALIIGEDKIILQEEGDNEQEEALDQRERL